MFYQKIGIKQGRPFQGRINRRQIIFISIVQKMFPEMLTGPSASIVPDSPERTVNSAGGTPYICIVMRHPSSGTIHIFCRLPAGNGHVQYHLQKGFMQFSQVCFFCRPVIHFCIDVDGVLTIPGRIQFVIPDALQVSGLSTGLGG